MVELKYYSTCYILRRRLAIRIHCQQASSFFNAHGLRDSFKDRFFLLPLCLYSLDILPFIQIPERHSILLSLALPNRLQLVLLKLFESFVYI